MSYLLCLIEVVLIFCIMFALFPYKYTRDIKYRYIIGTMVLLEAVVVHSISGISLIERDFIYCITVIVMMQILLEGKWYTKLFFAMLSIFLFLACDIVVMNIFMLVTGKGISEILASSSYVWFAISAKIANIGAIGVAIYFFRPIKLEIERKYWVIVNFLVFFFLCILQSYMLINEKLNQIGINGYRVVLFWVVYFAVCTGIIYLFGELCIFYQKEQEKILVEMKASALEDEIAIQLDHEETVQCLRHDIKNHIQNIMYLVKDNSVEELESYINNMNLQLEKIDTTRYTKNTVIDIILNRKLKECNNQGISITIKTDTIGKLPLTEMDMSSILTNLLDNAIEANERLESNRFIDVEMYHFKGYYVLKVKNSYDGLLIKHKGTILTRKEEKLSHGYCIHIVKKLVKRYHGEIEIQEDGRVFMVAVILPCFEKRKRNMPIKQFF